MNKDCDESYNCLEQIMNSRKNKYKMLKLVYGDSKSGLTYASKQLIQKLSSDGFAVGYKTIKE